MVYKKSYDNHSESAKAYWKYWESVASGNYDEMPSLNMVSTERALNKILDQLIITVGKSEEEKLREKMLKERS